MSASLFAQSSILRPTFAKLRLAKQGFGWQCRGQGAGSK